MAPRSVEEEKQFGHKTDLKVNLVDGTATRSLDFSAPSRTFPESLNTLLSQLPEVMNRLSPLQEFSYPFRTVLLPCIALASDFLLLVDATSEPIAITLPLAMNGGKILLIVKADSTGNAVTVQTLGTDKISSDSSIELSTQFSKALLVSDGESTWYRFI